MFLYLSSSFSFFLLLSSNGSIIGRFRISFFSFPFFAEEKSHDDAFRVKERKREKSTCFFLSSSFFLLFLSFASMTRLDVIYTITGSKGNFSTQGKGKVCITGVESIRGGIINELSPWETLSFSLSLSQNRLITYCIIHKCAKTVIPSPPPPHPCNYIAMVNHISRHKLRNVEEQTGVSIRERWRNSRRNISNFPLCFAFSSYYKRIYIYIYSQT